MRNAPRSTRPRRRAIARQDRSGPRTRAAAVSFRARSRVSYGQAEDGERKMEGRACTGTRTSARRPPCATHRARRWHVDGETKNARPHLAGPSPPAARGCAGRDSRSRDGSRPPRGGGRRAGRVRPARARCRRSARPPREAPSRATRSQAPPKHRPGLRHAAKQAVREPRIDRTARRRGRARPARPARRRGAPPSAEEPAARRRARPRGRAFQRAAPRSRTRAAVRHLDAHPVELQPAVLPLVGVGVDADDHRRRRQRAEGGPPLQEHAAARLEAVHGCGRPARRRPRRSAETSARSDTRGVAAPASTVSGRSTVA